MDEPDNETTETVAGFLFDCRSTICEPTRAIRTLVRIEYTKRVPKSVPTEKYHRY